MINHRPSDRRKHVVDQIARMLVNHIHQLNSPELEAKELSARLGCTRSVVENAWWVDIPELCERTGLELGITVRNRQGNTVTLWPRENFGDKPASKTAAKRPATPMGQKA